MRCGRQLRGLYDLVSVDEFIKSCFSAGAETRFYEFVDRNQIVQTPKLAATSHNDKAILMEFIEGSRVRPEDIGPNEFRAAFDFAMALNSNVSGVSRLSAASEACFSLSAYCDLLDNRITRLANLT